MQEEWKIDVNLLYTCESKRVTKWVRTSRREQGQRINKAIGLLNDGMVSVGYWIIGLSFSYYSLRLRGPNPISGVPDVKCKLVARPIGGRRGGFVLSACRFRVVEWCSAAFVGLCAYL